LLTRFGRVTISAAARFDWQSRLDVVLGVGRSFVSNLVNRKLSLQHTLPDFPICYWPEKTMGPVATRPLIRREQ